MTLHNDDSSLPEVKIGFCRTQKPWITFTIDGELESFDNAACRKVAATGNGAACAVISVLDALGLELDAYLEHPRAELTGDFLRKFERQEDSL